jgi:cytochrome b subunit of formate dehydrogenase
MDSIPEQQQHVIMPPPPLVALAGWLVPGAGYALIGQKLRGLVIGVTILLIFVSGLLIGGMRVVDSSYIESAQQRQERERNEADLRRYNRNYVPPNPIARTLQKPWFIGQVLAGPVAIASNVIATRWGGEAGSPFSHARVYEIGVLYTAVAGMLNLMAIIDAAYRASNEGAR